MDNILEIRNVVKNYSSKTAIDNVSFDVPRGEVFGMLGPNGAGAARNHSARHSALAPPCIGYQHREIFYEPDLLHLGRVQLFNTLNKQSAQKGKERPQRR